MRAVSVWRLEAPDERFGGLSGVAIAGERLFAVGDRGRWMETRIARDASGLIEDFSDATAGPLRDAAGVELGGAGGGDAEGLAVAPGGVLLVSFERGHRIVGYPSFDAASFVELETLPIEGLVSNGGIEALAIDPSGAAIAIAEEPIKTDPSGGLVGWRLTEAGARRFSITRSDGFLATGADFRTGRRALSARTAVSLVFGPLGAGSTLRAPIFEGGALGDGETVLTIAAGFDNFEAIDVAAAPDGGLALTLLTDDNFSRRQRTVLVQILVAAPPARQALGASRP